LGVPFQVRLLPLAFLSFIKLKKSSNKGAILNAKFTEILKDLKTVFKKNTVFSVLLRRYF
jgi:hypothetical protein